MSCQITLSEYEKRRNWIYQLRDTKNADELISADILGWRKEDEITVANAVKGIEGRGHEVIQGGRAFKYFGIPLTWPLPSNHKGV